MITYNFIKDAQDTLVTNWGEDGKRVIEGCFCENPYNKTFSEFLKECTACGGNWGGMFLTGIKTLYPKVYEIIPDDMGVHAFACICSTLLLLGIDTSE